MLDTLTALDTFHWISFPAACELVLCNTKTRMERITTGTTIELITWVWRKQVIIFTHELAEILTKHFTYDDVDVIDEFDEKFSESKLIH